MENSTVDIETKSAVQIVLRECPAKNDLDVLNIKRQGDNVI